LRPPPSTLFPYTTLFRSVLVSQKRWQCIFNSGGKGGARFCWRRGEVTTALSSRAKSRDSAEVTLKLSQRDSSSPLGITGRKIRDFSTALGVTRFRDANIRGVFGKTQHAILRRIDRR